MKIGLYFCNIVAFIYRSRMLDEVLKCALTIERIIELNVHRAVRVHPEFVIGGGGGTDPEVICNICLI